MIETKKFLTCCKQGQEIVVWRKVNSFCGPLEEGWSMISHLFLRSPEYVHICFCPFCGKEITSGSINR